MSDRDRQGGGNEFRNMKNKESEGVFITEQKVYSQSYIWVSSEQVLSIGKDWCVWSTNLIEGRIVYELRQVRRKQTDFGWFYSSLNERSHDFLSQFDMQILHTFWWCVCVMHNVVSVWGTHGHVCLCTCMSKAKQDTGYLPLLISTLLPWDREMETPHFS